MLEIGKYNSLKVVKLVDFGLYLDGGDAGEILLPARYLDPENLPAPGDTLKVFIYRDSEERLIATTEHPFATVGKFAFLQVTEVNKVGAFLDWGLPKQLLVPYREQKTDMKPGGIYLVYVYLDDVTKRIVASAKIEKFLGNRFPDYKPGEKVTILPYSHTEIGLRCIVDDLFYGMLYDNELYTTVEIGITRDAWVKNVRDDGKIDLRIAPAADERTDRLAQLILDRLAENGGPLPVSDSSSPELIRDLFACSKKDFKKAIGRLYKQHAIIITPTHITIPQ